MSPSFRVSRDWSCGIESLVPSSRTNTRSAESIFWIFPSISPAHAGTGATSSRASAIAAITLFKTNPPLQKRKTRNCSIRSKKARKGHRGGPRADGRSRSLRILPSGHHSFKDLAIDPGELSAWLLLHSTEHVFQLFELFRETRPVALSKVFPCAGEVLEGLGCQTLCGSVFRLHGPLGCIRRDGSASEDLAERSLQRLLHGDPVAEGRDDALELREPAPFRGQIEGLNVEERLFNRDGEQAPPDHLGARLAPEGDLL